MISDPSRVDTPVSVAIDLESLRKSENPLEKSSAEIISMLQDIRSMVSDTESVPRRSKFDPHLIEELVMHLDHLASVLDSRSDKEPNRERLEKAQRILYRFIRMLEIFAMESGIPSDVVENLMIRLRHRMSLMRRESGVIR